MKIIKGKHLNFKNTEVTPGQIVEIHKNGIETACGQGSVFLIESLQPENKKTMEAYAFSLGSRIFSGLDFKRAKEKENL